MMSITNKRTLEEPEGLAVIWPEKRDDKLA
uniref:Uncharacterized protein n=1 Tax=Rhizophora mucronata TaxID=61149 RepID=A0A2P2JQ72_RHIMU